MRSSMSSFFIKEASSFEPRATSAWIWLAAHRSELSVHRHFPIHASRPGIDAAAHGLRFLKSLLPQPYRHVHRSNAVMADNHDVVLRIQFLVCPRGHFAHRHQLGARNLCRFEFPGFAHIEQREILASVELALHFFGGDLVIHIDTAIGQSTSADAYP